MAKKLPVETPVYLFLGFLESGKTTFIQETMQDPRFSSGEKTLLLVMEEGVEEYETIRFSNAENIDLVTPTHYLPVIIPALSPELPVPVVYNCGGYERIETLNQLEGRVDIYLPDLKYFDNALAMGLSGCSDYRQVATAAIREMVRQTGPVQWEGEKVTKGVIVRHLILPGQVENSLKVLDWIGDTFAPGEVLVSLMRQYIPHGKAEDYPELNRKVTDEEYQAVEDHLFDSGIEDGFVQDESSATDAFIPTFDGSGV